MHLAVLLLLLTTALSVRSASSQSCQCGYTVNATLFTEALETDFLHVKDLARDTNHAWIPQAYNVTPANANGPFGKASQVENVTPNPVKDGRDSWQGPGEIASDPGLQLWARSSLIHEMVPMAEIVSARDDILYGSFRIGMKTTSVSGTCGAFFFYFNDSNEIDMEFLSKQNSNRTINLVIQSPESEARGYATGPDFNKKTLQFAPDKDYNEYRFDWFPSRVDFYANSVLLSSITENVPDTPGKIHISHWSNGNPGWSGGPPEEDAVLTVSYVKAYFNTSSSGAGRERCEERCEVPDQSVPPSPTGDDGETEFFTPQGANETAEDGTGADPEEGSAVSISTDYDSLVTILLAFMICCIAL